MESSSRDIIQSHIHSHTRQESADIAAVAYLENIFASDERIIPNFSDNDKWPNIDGTFEFVPDPINSGQPVQNFFTQIKGTAVYSESGDTIKYTLKDLAFPAFMATHITLDPGILFVVLNPKESTRRVFWKYMSVVYLNSIDFKKASVTITFTPKDEIKPTAESFDDFCSKLLYIVDHHSFVGMLDNRAYSKEDMIEYIRETSKDIDSIIRSYDPSRKTRDSISKGIIRRLNELCVSALVLNALEDGQERIDVRLAWEKSLLSIDTKYLGSFFKALRYIGRRIPREGQSERLMLKYYDFLWQIRKFTKERYKIEILKNLDDFPLDTDHLDIQYYELVASAIESSADGLSPLRATRYYIQRKVPFYIGSEKYYELTLQLAGVYATKYNRITAYTKINISTNYSIMIGYNDASIQLWETTVPIKVITNWKVSIDPTCLNKLARILNIQMRLSTNYGEYNDLMAYLTQTGINFLDLIDFQSIRLEKILDDIYRDSNTKLFREVLIALKRDYDERSTVFGRNTVRYLLLNLREETLVKVMPSKFDQNPLHSDAYLAKACFPFEKNPYISNLAGTKSSEGHQKTLSRVTGCKALDVVRPYLMIKNKIQETGEIYFNAASIAPEKKILEYNDHLDQWEKSNGYQISYENDRVYIDEYEKTTIFILRKLLSLASSGNGGQEKFNAARLRPMREDINDLQKLHTLETLFVNSKVLLIYGAAGTGKTTLINYISTLMRDSRKLFLTKTHAALQNLKRRIDNPGPASQFFSIDSFTRKEPPAEYDIVFVDECSTIDNRTMAAFLRRVNPNALVVLAGDIHQIESIDFGNWFFYAKEIIRTKGANVELLGNWRTQEEGLLQLWDAVRKRSEMTEKLAIEGPFSANIGPDILQSVMEDEVILCLNYDGKFGLNNMNNYFQNANKSSKAFYWQEWSYKVGDPILFNETRRFPALYNNLKGRIVSIEGFDTHISFVIDAEVELTENACINSSLEFISFDGERTRFKFDVFAYNDAVPEEEKEQMRMNSVIPFQLAYAVSIHKAQGLEYDSVKVIIPNSNVEMITHGVFYTAITRAKKRLKIYWSAETMKEVLKSFDIDKEAACSLDIIRSKLPDTES